MVKQWLVVTCVCGLVACSDEPSTLGPMDDAGTNSAAPDAGDPDAGDNNAALDTQSPVVTISSGGTTSLGGGYTLTGTFSDDVGVTRLTYNAGDGDVEVPEPTSPFSVDLTLEATTEIVVRAFDAVGNEGIARVDVAYVTDAIDAQIQVFGTRDTLSPTVFDASASEDPQSRELSFSWDFGDGTTATGAVVGHLFSAEGTYTVTLTVTADDGDAGTASVDIVVMDATGTGTQAWKGVVLTPSGVPIPGVDILDPSGQVVATTDGEGRYALDVAGAKTQVFWLERDGYTRQVVREDVASSDVFVVTRMAPRAALAFLLDAGTGGVVVGPNGASISFEPGSLVDAESGEAVSGAVGVTVTPLDVGAGDLEALPGVFLGAAPTGDVRQIATVGAMEVQMAQNGRRVELAPGKSATVEVPYSGAGDPATGYPFWMLHERSGIWVQISAPASVVQTASGRAIRVEVPDLSWMNAGQSTDEIGLVAVRPSVELTVDGSPRDLTVDLELDYSRCVAPGGLRASVSAVRAGDVVEGMFANCAIGVSARTKDGRYFAQTEVTLVGPPVFSIALEDSLALPELVVGTPVEATLASGEVHRYRFTTQPGKVHGVHVHQLINAQGVLRVSPTHRNARTAATFPPDGYARVASLSEETWIVEVQGLQAGTYQLAQDVLAAMPLRASQPATQTIAQGQAADWVVQAAPGDLGRLRVEGGPGLQMSVLNGGNTDLATRGESATDSGVMAFDGSHSYLVRVQNTGVATMARLFFDRVASPSAMHVGAGIDLAGSLSRAQVHAFATPRVPNSALVAHVSANVAAPMLSLVSADDGAFPVPTLNARSTRSPEGTEAAVGHLLAASVAQTDYLYVAASELANGGYALTVDRAMADASITAGTCAIADTRSAVAGALALTSSGKLSLCPGTHRALAGLRFPAPVWTLEGAGATSELSPWAGALRAVGAGAYGDDDPYLVTSAVVRNLAIANQHTAIEIVGDDAALVTIDRVEVTADAPRVGVVGRATCVDVSAPSGSSAMLTVDGLQCFNAEVAVQSTGVDTLDVRNSELETSLVGISSIGALASIVKDNLVTAPLGISLTSQAGSSDVSGNLLFQTVGAVAAIDVVTRVPSTSTGVVHSIVDNQMALDDFGTGIRASYQTANGDFRIDGNRVEGSAPTQTGVHILPVDSSFQAGRVAIQNNVFAAVGPGSVNVATVDGLAGLSVVNNTFYAPDVDTAAEAFFVCDVRSTVGTLVLANNLYVGGGGGYGYIGPALVDVTSANNMFWNLDGGGQSGTDAIAGDQLANPLLDVAFKPAANSPAINAGNMLYAPAAAIDGVMRPQGGSPDIGAHEQ